MTRLLSTTHYDLRLQFRYGFYYAGAFVAVVWIALLRLIPRDTLDLLIPAFLFFSLNITTFYFIAGLVLFEKGEGSLEALVVTPLRVGEYLLSKLLTLTLLALIESVIIILLAYGYDLQWLPLLLGSVLLAVMYALFGFVVIVRYDSINRFLIPSGLFVAIVQLPVVSYFGLWESWVWYLWPTEGPLLLLKAAFQPVEPWQVAYGLIYAALWIALLFGLAQRLFHRFIVKRVGVRLR